MRSLGPTLISAAASFAVFAVANWGNCLIFLPVSQSFVRLLILQVMYALGMPNYGLYLSVDQATQVWRWKRALANALTRDTDPINHSSWWSKLQHRLDDHNRIAIMLVCPIFLEVIQPSELFENIRQSGHDRANPELYSLKELKEKWCPLELCPASTYNNIQADDEDIRDVQSDHADIQAHEAVVANHDQEAVGKYVNIQATDADIQAHPAVVASHDQEANIQADVEAEAHVDIQADAVQSDANIQPAHQDHDEADVGKYIQASIYTDNRMALLMSGLAPEYKELRYLRMRNRFQTMVTALQVGGYMLGVIQRMAQHLDITPIEAILLFLCILTALQLLIELYACGTYQRPLLLRLTPHQVSRLNHTFKNHPIKPHHLPFSPRARKIIVVILCNLAMFLMSPFLIYYIYHYWHVSLVSALAALLFVLSIITSSILQTKYKLSGQSRLCKWEHAIGLTIVEGKWREPLSWICSYVICFGGMVVAVVATIKDRHTFEQPTRNWFAWILPHVSS